MQLLVQEFWRKGRQNFTGFHALMTFLCSSKKKNQQYLTLKGLVLYLILFVLFWNYWYFKTQLVRCPSYTFVAYCYRNHKFKIKLIKELYYHKRTVDKIWYNFVIKKWQKLCNLFVDTLFSMLTENLVGVRRYLAIVFFFFCFEKN